MKDLTISDIFSKKPRPVTKLSVQVSNGRWRFRPPPSNPLITGDGSIYYKMEKPFGVVSNKERDPRKMREKGLPGDYLVRNRTGEYIIITEERFLALYPTPNALGANLPPLSSELIKDPIFYNNILKESPTRTYNN